MDTKTVATITVFAALTITLNLSPIKFPAPYATYLIYQLWEIPIVAAFLLYGNVVGSFIALINTLILVAVFPGELLTGPLYNLAAVLSMLLGVGMGRKIAKKYVQENSKLLLVLFTVSGVALRVGIMTFVNWAFLRFPPPVGFNMPEEVILLSIPLIAVFNATLALYTVPSGYFVAKVVKSSTTPV